MLDAIVITADVAPGEGALAGEPVTTAIVRRVADGRERVVRIVGGPTPRGGFARLAGHVVPTAGARVRFDLREPVAPPASTSPNKPALTGPRWAPSAPAGISPAALTGPRWAPSAPAGISPAALTGPRWAPSTPAGTWPAEALPLTFDLATPPSRDVGDDAAAELEVAARTWGRPACTSFRARFGEVVPALAGDDGVNVVVFHDAAWPAELDPDAVAQTILHDDGAGRLRDADIHVNGARFRFSTDGAPGTQDLRSVLVHEIGHALGLGHTPDPRATMHVSGSGLWRRSLEDDDVQGVCALYPGVGSSGCDANPCPETFRCVAGACQRRREPADVCSPCTPERGACDAAGDGARCLDVGSGAEAGRACGRPCATDAECGAGFSCAPTTEAGDRQCVSLDACRNGASPCASDADCAQPGSSCRAGACLGPPAERTDAGADGAGADDAGADDADPPAASGSGCRASRASTWPGAPLALLALAVLRASRARAQERRGRAGDRVS